MFSERHKDLCGKHSLCPFIFRLQPRFALPIGLRVLYVREYISGLTPILPI